MRAGHLIWAGAVWVAWAGSAVAQAGTPAAVDELDRLDDALLDLTRDVSASDSEVSIEKLRSEIVELRLMLSEYKDMLDAKSHAITELEDENRKLRQALRIRYGRQDEGLPTVPMPNRDLIESVLKDSPPRGASTREEQAAPEDSLSVSAVAERYTVISEWGRSPAVAANFGANVSSLIGLAVVVPTGTGQEDLRALGRELREKYEVYDNINIEVYDDENAARRYSEEGVGNSAHRMLSISKHKHSERDTIILFIDGVPTQIR